MTTIKQIFVNLPIKDLDKSMKFWSHLGFKFNPQFTDKNAACMIVGENIFCMLLVEKFFRGFIKKEISDAHKTTEVINAISVSSRKDVDEIIKKAFEAGAKPSGNTQDAGWMYIQSFQDLDGHLWEIAYMDMAKAPKTP
ncbi:glyoxalase/bleomycin resistance/extradiol dioxygenase family protein [Candidatus Pacearchaeota archaeon]|nr:glyoxalase/bleomycin resistance/extradiol dioxygenase family protein [Candidatus Pacearchaeota archaeon]